MPVSREAVKAAIVLEQRRMRAADIDDKANGSSDAQTRCCAVRKKKGTPASPMCLPSVAQPTGSGT
jgi:hypothetical protein